MEDKAKKLAIHSYNGMAIYTDPGTHWAFFILHFKFDATISSIWETNHQDVISSQGKSIISLKCARVRLSPYKKKLHVQVVGGPALA